MLIVHKKTKDTSRKHHPPFWQVGDNKEINDITSVCVPINNT